MTAKGIDPRPDRTLTAEDFAAAFGVPAAAFDPETRRLIGAGDFRHQPLDEAESTEILADIRARLDAGSFPQVGSHREGLWEDVWAESLQRFEAEGGALGALDPAFMSSRAVYRWQRRFIRAVGPRFEYDFFGVVRHWCARRYLAEPEHIFEFGCGSGFNLAALAGTAAPGQAFTGLDWSPSSVRIAERLGEVLALPIHGRRFDFFHPDAELILPPETAVVTFAALEQIGHGFEAFLDFLLDRRPSVVVHMEPVAEFYDPAEPLDAAALRYHHDRGFLSGYLTRLRELEEDRRVVLIEARRLGFGSLYHEAYSLIAWRPAV